MAEAPAHGAVLAAVRERWGLAGAQVRPLGGGMNSATWTVLVPSGQRWAAKLVRPDQRDGFVRGLRAAAVVEGAGIPSGAPLPTADGRDHVDLSAGPLALLRWVDGVPLQGGRDADQRLLGSALGRAHRVLREAAEASARDFPRWLDPGAAHLDVQGWVRPAVRSALAGYRAFQERGGDVLGPGLLHGDPEPGAFLRSPSPSPSPSPSRSLPERCGIIDWSSSEQGPLLYDLASALLYVGGPGPGRSLVEAYAVEAGVPAPDLSEGAEVLLVLRQAVQADYFARRLATDDLTGIADAEGNRVGLRHAEEFFAGLG